MTDRIHFCFLKATPIIRWVPVVRSLAGCEVLRGALVMEMKVLSGLALVTRVVSTLVVLAMALAGLVGELPSGLHLLVFNSPKQKVCKE